MLVKKDHLKSIKLTSTSKINLGLWVKEKRSDNYHEIETVLLENKETVDEIEIEINDNAKDQIRVDFTQDKFNKLIVQNNNSAYKAAKLFFENLGGLHSCSITINKKIPLEAGLGGGSSNAAFVLKGLNELYNYPFSEFNLLTMASKIGSDVPFFILGESCLAKGRGEILKPLKNNLQIEIKILKPENLGISTKWAYEQLDSREFIADHSNDIKDLIASMESENYNLFFKNIFNDFETAIFSLYPELLKIRNSLMKEGFLASGLCGSGSAMFGIRQKT